MLAQAKFRSHAHVDGALFVDLFGHGRDAGARLPEFSRHPGEINELEGHSGIHSDDERCPLRTMQRRAVLRQNGCYLADLIDWDAGLRGNVIQRNLCDRRFQSRKRLRMLRVLAASSTRSCSMTALTRPSINRASVPGFTRSGCDASWAMLVVAMSRRRSLGHDRRTASLIRTAVKGLVSVMFDPMTRTALALVRSSNHSAGGQSDGMADSVNII